MKKFLAILDKFLVPIATRFATQRHLMSIRDGFVAILPLSLAGSFSVLLNVFLRDIPTSLNGGKPSDFTEMMAPVIAINGTVF